MNENIEKIKEQISAYLDGELSQEETSQVEDLILHNKEWQKYYKQLQGLKSVLTEWDDETVSPDLTTRVQKSLLEHKLKEDKKMSKPSFSKQLAPVLTMVTVLIVGLLAMQVYIKRGVQGRLKHASDDIGDQFRAGNTNAYQPYTKVAREGRARDAAVDLAKTTADIGSRAQYEPYYLETDYKVNEAKKERGISRKAYNQPLTTGTDGMKNMAGRIQSNRDTFSSGVTQSQIVASEATDAIAYSNVVNTQQEFWGGESAPARQIAKAKPTNGRFFYDDVDVVVEEESYMPYDRRDNQFNTENYNRIYENEFLTVDENPLSTFSIDVDTASYANLRRFLSNGQLPPKDAVRIEEMINYFSYNYPEPKKGDPFSVTLKASQAPWNPNHNLVLVGLQGMTLEQNQIPPSNLVFLIDVSGSMNNANKLPLLKEAFKMMVNQLGPNERVAIVVYAGAAGEVLPSTSGANKQAILAAIDRLQAGGSTAGGAGIKLAYQIAKQNFIKGGNNRVILATDGDFNIGVSNDADLTRLIEEKREDGIFLTTLGFGTGNYKDSRMEQIANKGNGNHYYIDTHNEARKVLVRELGSTLFTIAKDVKLQLEFNPAQVNAYRLIGYENRMLAKEDFNDDTKDAGELGAGHTVTAIYEIVPADSPETFGAVDKLKYQVQQAIASQDLLTVKLRYKKPDGNKSTLIQESIKMNEITVEPGDDFQFASAVAEFGLLLRNSRFKGNANINSILTRANEAKGSDRFGYRAEFISLVQKASALMPQHQGDIEFKDDVPQPAPQGGMFFKGGQN